MGPFHLSGLRRPMNCDGKRDCSGTEVVTGEPRAHSGRFERGVGNVYRAIVIIMQRGNGQVGRDADSVPCAS
jgi:hypothetical protein